MSGRRPSEFGNVIVLSGEFDQELMAHPLPTDLEVIMVLAASPAASRKTTDPSAANSRREEMSNPAAPQPDARQVTSLDEAVARLEPRLPACTWITVLHTLVSEPYGMTLPTILAGVAN